MKTKFLCRVSRYDDYEDEPEKLSPDDPQRVVIEDVIDVPFDDDVITWFQEGEGYLECGGKAGYETIPDKGGFYWVTISYSTDYDDGHIDWVWVENLTLATAEEVTEAKATDCAWVAQDEEARLRAGCAFYGHRAWYDEPPRCQKSKSGRRGDGSWPGCSRKDGQICLAERWKPLEMARWEFPVNHFLDGNGVCKWAGTAIGVLPACNQCSGLPLYPGDCPGYEERPLAHDEIILPDIWGRGWGKSFDWRFRVHKLDKPEPGIRQQRLSLPPIWSQWYSGSNSEGDTTMWTVVGIPVTGMGWIDDEPNGKPARQRGKGQFERRAFRKAKLTLDRLASDWRELHLVDNTVGEIILTNPRVMRAKTVNAVMTTLWHGLITRACDHKLRYTLRGNNWGHAHSMFPWKVAEDGTGWPDKYNLSAIVRGVFREKLSRMVTGRWPGRSNCGDGEFGPVLFPAVVVSPELRWAYGLVGAPNNLGQDRWSKARPERCEDADPDFINAAGRRMTKDAFSRLRESWRKRYRKP